MDVEQHDRIRREVEGHVIGESSPRPTRNDAASSLADQINIANVAISRVEDVAARSIEPILQDERQIVSVSDPEDQSFFGI